MQNIVYREPCLLYEALELSLAAIHQIPAERLTVPGTYCLPLDTVEWLLREATVMLPPDHDEIAYYFGKHNVPSTSGRPITIASTLLYAFIHLGPVEEALAAMAESWNSLRQGRFRVMSINDFTLEFAPLTGDGRTLLSAELARLKLPQDYKMAVMECFSDFSHHLRQIHGILQPVMTLLETALRPYVQAAMPLIQEWVALVEKVSCEEFLMGRVKMVVEDDSLQLRMALRYLDCRIGPGQTDTLRQIAWFHISIAQPVTPASTAPAEEMTAKILRAFHLLGDRSRADLLHAIGNGKFTMQDLSVQLRQNPGTVFKNLNALTDAGILYQDCRDGRRYYRIHKENLRSVLRQVEDYILPEDEASPV